LKLKRNTYAWVAIEYAKKVTSGKIEACWQVKAACQRTLDDLERTDLVFDTARIDHVCDFASALPHVIGPLAGQNIKLEPFQIYFLANIFGFVVRKTGLRKYREAFVLLPRGSAKSTLAAIIGLYMTFAEGQGGARGLSGATSLKQASFVFTPARQMALKTPALVEALGLEVNARSIYQPSTGSSFQAVKANTEDGDLPWCAIADELHEAKSSVQLDTFRTGMGKRKGGDPLLLIISTAGTNVGGICRQEQLYFESVLSKTLKDDSKFALIYTIDKDDDWKDFRVWKKANPNYGISVDEDHLRREYDKALQSPSAQSICLTKYLNVWCNTADGWLNQRQWAEAATPALVIPADAPCYIGVDLATKTDITAICLVARLPDGRLAIIPHLFLPTGALDRSQNSKAYEEWIASGALIGTEGEASDHSEVEDRIRELCTTYNVQGVLFDPWQSAGMSQRLAADGLKVIDFAQRASNFGPAMTDFEADLMNGKIVHDDNACMNWMASNISFKMKGPFMNPGKPTGQDHLKIDGMITALMAYAQLQDAPAPPAAPMLFFA
jgi:phage terminase large subunit-like protein